MGLELGNALWDGCPGRVNELGTFCFPSLTVADGGAVSQHGGSRGPPAATSSSDQSQGVGSNFIGSSHLRVICRASGSRQCLTPPPSGRVVHRNRCYSWRCHFLSTSGCRGRSALWMLERMYLGERKQIFMLLLHHSLHWRYY